MLMIIILCMLSGDGVYGDGDGIKQGNWVEICNGFDYYSQVTGNGEYKNGKKVVRWEIWYKVYEDSKQNLKIGGGSYDEGGDKLGNWVELSDSFSDNSKVIYDGVYKNGNKIGRWDIWYKEDDESIKIGGGQYDEEVDGIKFNNWVEESEGFCNSSQVTWDGEYKNGRKVGKWNILFENQNMQNINDFV